MPDRTIPVYGDSPRYWHGGVRGLNPGDLLLPPTEHKGPTLMQYAPLCREGSPGAKDALASGQHVFVTTNKSTARVFAQVYPPPGGALYVVEPVGDVKPDPDCPDESFLCERARIVQVYDGCVAFNPGALAKL